MQKTFIIGWLKNKCITLNQKTMKDIELSKHSFKSLEFILSEANKLLEQTLKSISETTNKSYILFAVYSSIITYSFNKVLDSNFSYTPLLIGGLVSVLIIYENLFPNIIRYNGVLPEKLTVEYFDEFSEDNLAKEYLATAIQSYNYVIVKNQDLIENMSNKFQNSIKTMICFLFIFGLWSIISFAERS